MGFCGCRCGIDKGRESFDSSSSESLELFSLLDEADELFDSDELSELLICSITLASAFSSEKYNVKRGKKEFKAHIITMFS